MRLIRHHGLGNDYLVLESGPSLTPDLVRAICDRHTGVGSDGILEPVRPSLDGADHTVRIWNPDGSIAEKSGNGIRIFARWAAQGPSETMSIHTTFDLVHAWVTGDDVRVEMGRARFGASEIPALNSRIDQPIPEVERPVVAVGVGNPHCVTFIDAFPEDWAALGARIEVHPWFPNRTNVQFARVIDVTGAVWRELAVNDVYLERSTGQTAHFAVQIDGETFVDDLVADGVLLATALGSTAYTFSAGGPPCHPDLRALCITPICPHQPRLPAVVLPETARARVDVLKKDLRPARAVIDGRAIESVATVEAGFEDESVQLAFWSDVSLTSRLVRKILVPWP